MRVHINSHIFSTYTLFWLVGWLAGIHTLHRSWMFAVEFSSVRWCSIVSSKMKRYLFGPRKTASTHIVRKYSAVFGTRFAWYCLWLFSFTQRCIGYNRYRLSMDTIWWYCVWCTVIWPVNEGCCCVEHAIFTRWENCAFRGFHVIYLTLT